MGTTKVHWVLDDEAIAIIDSMTTPGKRGELVSDIIRIYGRLVSVLPMDDELDCGVQERIEQRLARIEQRIALLQLQVNGEALPVAETLPRPQP